MRDKKRIKRMLKYLEKIWSWYPDQRFGQLLINCQLVPDDNSVWNREDEIVEIVLETLANEIDIYENKEIKQRKDKGVVWNPSGQGNSKDSKLLGTHSPADKAERAKDKTLEKDV